VTWFWMPVFRREFVFRRDRKKVLTLYAIKKKKEKRVFSLDDLIRLTRPQKVKKADTKKALAYIHSKAEYDIKIKFVIGTGDACLTALSCGLLQIVIGTLYAIRKNPNIKLQMRICPDYSKQGLRFTSDCIIKASPANIMIGYMIYKKTLRR